MWSIFQKSRYIIILIVFFILIFLSYTDYQNTRQVIYSKYSAQHTVVEKSILNTIKHANITYQIVEKQLNKIMREYSLIMIDKYRNNPDISKWNLDQLQNQFTDYEIYIIDSNFKIIETTFKPDLGMDFSTYPAFSQLLARRMQGDKFISDRMELSTNTGKIKKYSYIPTPDHRYLLELSIDIEKNFPILENFNVFSLADKLTEQYDPVEKISIYKFNSDGSSIGETSRLIGTPFIDTNIAEDKKEIIRETIQSNQIKTMTRNESPEVSYTFKYLPFLNYDKDGKLDWWNSNIIEIKYNDNIILTELKKQQNSFLFNTLIITAVFTTFILVVTYLFKKTEHIAYHDHLTGLPNRKLFEEKFNQILSGIKGKDDKLAVFFMDLDNFKDINDTFGHNTGDRLLKMVAKRLKNSLRKNDIISRMGGDEFTILITDISSYDDTDKVAQKISNLFNRPFVIENQEFVIQPSIGISLYPKDGLDPERLLKKADDAMYQAKNEKNHFKIYTEPSC